MNKAIIIANMRSASTMLVSAMVGHSRIDGYDGEILLYESPWRDYDDSARDVMERFYASNDLAKVTYVQVTEPVLGFVVDHDLPIIHLTRPSADRWAFSAITNRKTEDPRYKHITVDDERPQAPEFEVDPQEMVRLARRCLKNQRRFAGLFNNLGVPLMHTTYDAITGGEGRSAEMVPEKTARELCEFMGVPYEPLTTHRRKSGFPMEDVITNWGEVRTALAREGLV
jgi:hypothetical protein